MKLLHTLLLGSLLVLAGCATTSGPDLAGTTGPSPSPAPHSPMYPKGPLSPLGTGSASNGDVASLETTGDLWVRIRQGFAMPDLDQDLVKDREQWYASRPDYIQRMTERSSKYLFHIVEELERRNMPTELALLPYIESAFNPQAVSTAKAAGMWQFMPATGTYFDLKQNAFRDDRRDVLASTRAALDYLQKLYDMFGDWHLALAAYNWGEGSVGRAIKRNEKLGLPTGYTDLQMPAETRMYVPKLQAVKNIVANPDAFNTELPVIENHPYFQTVTITRDIDVELVAKLADVSTEDFKALNPSFRKPVIFAAGTPEILLPWDNAKVFRRNMQAFDEGQYASWTVWTVPSTISVAEAAQRVGLGESDLRALNNIPPRMLIKAGSALMVPRGANVRADVAGHVADNGQISFAPEIITRRTTIKARKRDTLISVANRYGVSVSNLADWNDLKSSATLHAGQSLVAYLPVRASSGGNARAAKSTGTARKVAVQPQSRNAKAAVTTAQRGGKPSKVKKR
ncbi:transglycosylase SLT domain-containing protein [Delftia tsuruhatensis]|uniref:transglycosylase SLT domain-containing protein n=1 Tax=Delftia tsuruhatensis TaxID=180282 RepID=UPI0024447871|nr:transglycosylase SLT domain-containing protein [Delftia tsuruhatensis]MDH0774143.1 transglycosylase SLT domain-containing protein [Delftia tsuruhatensis]MDH1458156.1 transglycosylase SLT domain-containing protein [Delftia tsuruhatensis]MDH1823560.1 transglycosylase SLT domain-containing protein [Delftia tsuruhatensis]WGG12919.1 transglycosylase SLT domain-containing protein [Delftia tsuruhatensis]